MLCYKTINLLEIYQLHVTYRKQDFELVLNAKVVILIRSQYFYNPSKLRRKLYQSSCLRREILGLLVR